MDDLPTLHHVGVATRDVATEATPWLELLGYRIVKELTHDPIQRVRVLFLASGDDKTLVELVEPADTDSPIHRILKEGGGLYHLCYEVDDLDNTLSRVRDGGCLIIGEPAAAAAFDGRRIAWVFTPTRRLIELLERDSST